MTLLPIFLKLDNRRCLLVGAGSVALDKIGSLLKTGIELRVVAPEARPEIKALAAEGKLELILRPFELADLDGNFVVITATNAPHVNRAVYQGALERNIPCNSVDDIPNCDFYFGSVVTRGDLQIAISTAGQSPAFAQRLRREIDEQLPQDLGPWLADLGQLRRDVLTTHPRGEQRRLLLHELAQRQICDAPTCSTRQIAQLPVGADENSPAQAQRSPGTGRLNSVRPVEAEPKTNLDSAAQVSLVGAGPGNPDLLTVKALRRIQSADLILHDDLVPQSILDLASPTAEILNVGKRCGVKTITQDQINALMIHHARNGQSVVRLKSGDPLLFGRAAEELAALADESIPIEIVPGVSAAFAAAAALGRSLTDRACASSVVFSTGHHAQSHNHAPLPELQDATRVVYMPGRDLTLLAREWLEQGLPPDFPCAVISHAAQSDQQVLHTTLAALGNLKTTQAPSLLIAGWAVRHEVEPQQSQETAEFAAASLS